MRLLVTGGAGFIGSEVVRQALHAGHEVVTLDRLSYAAAPGTLAMLEHPRHRVVVADLRERDHVLAIVQQVAPDAVVHAAAESHVDRSLEDAHATVTTNVVGTQNLLDAVRTTWGAHPAADARLVVVSTDEVYGTVGTEGRFTEDHAPRPRNPYAASKAAADHLALAAFHTWGLPVVVTHGTNTYGPRQFPEKLVPVIVLAALHGAPLPVYGDGRHAREWLHVTDHAAGLLAALNGRPGRRYNLGSGQRTSNLDLVRRLTTLLDDQRPAHAPHADAIAFVPDRPGHDRAYALDASRAAEELGWRATLRLDEGLAQTVAWYLDHEPWWQPLLARHPVGLRRGAP